MYVYPPGEAGGGRRAGHSGPKKVDSQLSMYSPIAFHIVLCIMGLVKNVTLNFPEVFLERLRLYARKHGMKLNAVLKRAFELLEDHEP